MSIIKGVLFDFGNVLTSPTPPDFLKPLADIARIPLADFQPLYWQDRLAFDRGDLSIEQFWSDLGQRRNLHYDAQTIDHLSQLDANLWVNHLNADMLSWIPKLRGSGYRVGILSNAPTTVARALEPKLPKLDMALFSADVRLVKPEAEIYRIALERLGTSAPQTLFLDDLEVNVRAAETLGIQAILFQPPFKKALQTLANLL
jgi:putative hydrolase of the HAD superfamily